MSNELTRTEQFTPDQIDLIKRTLLKTPDGSTASNDELKLFLYQCQRTQLDPFSKQIYSMFRWDTKQNRNVMTIGISIDGQRVISERSGKYRGMTPRYWCGADGDWKDVWLDTKPPAAAKVGIYVEGFQEPVWGVALWSEYVQTMRDGKPMAMWGKMPATMLAKCAESLARRSAMPQDLSGLYTPEEMGQAENESETVKMVDQPSAPVEQTKATNGDNGHDATRNAFVEKLAPKPIVTSAPTFTPPPPAPQEDAKPKRATVATPKWSELISRAIQYGYVTESRDTPYRLLAVVHNAGIEKITEANLDDAWFAISRHYEAKKDQPEPVTA